MALPHPDPVRIAPALTSATSSSNADARFDPLSSYPTFPLRDTHIHEANMLAQQRCAPTEAMSHAEEVPMQALAHPPAFVPTTAQGAGPWPLQRLASDAAQKRAAASLPLDQFDSFELDLLPPQQLLAQAIRASGDSCGGAAALTRHYDVDVRPSAPLCSSHSTYSEQLRLCLFL